MEPNGIMYLARVVNNRAPVIHRVNDWEFTIAVTTHAGNVIESTCEKVKRAPHSWPIKCFGVVGAAAIAYTPGAAVGAAIVLLEAMHIRRLEKKSKPNHADNRD